VLSWKIVPRGKGSRTDRVWWIMENMLTRLCLMILLLTGASACSGEAFRATPDDAGRAGATEGDHQGGSEDLPGGSSADGPGGAGGDPAGGQSGSGGAGGDPAGGQSGSGGAGGDPAGGQSGSGGAGGDPAGGQSGSGGAGGDPAGGAGQFPTGGAGSGGQDIQLPTCNAEEIQLALPATFSLDSWRYDRQTTNHCGRCVSDPCLSCVMVWTDSPRWRGNTVELFATGAYNHCSALLELGECGSEEPCVLDDAPLTISIDVEVEPCGDRWCVSNVHMKTFATGPACLVLSQSEDSLLDAASDELLNLLSNLSWSCPS